MKIIITESKLEKFALNWLNDNYGDLEPFESEEYPDYIFYRKGDVVIFEYNKKNNVVYISYNEIWSFFEMYLNMNYQQIQAITEIWAEEDYNLRVTSVFINYNS